MVKKIQTLIFDGRIFNKRSVKEWISKEGFKLMKSKKNPIDSVVRNGRNEKYKEYRVRQLNPWLFNKPTFARSKLIKSPNRKKEKEFRGVKALFGTLKKK